MRIWYTTTLFFSILFLYLTCWPLLYWEVSWCSWLSHHFYVVRVPGSNPGGTIFVLFMTTSLYFILNAPYYFIILSYSIPLFKKAAEGSFDQPTCKLWACRATTAPPRFLLLITLPSFSKNSIAGNRTRGANVRGLHVTNYTTMDSYIYYILLY